MKTIVKALITCVVAVIILYAFCYIVAHFTTIMYEHDEALKYNNRYTCVINSMLSSEEVYCDSFSIKENSYLLYDKKSKLIKLISTSNGYSVIIYPTK